MDKVRVALVGHGYLGKWHLEKMQVLGNATCVGIVEVDPEKCKELQAQFPHLRVTTSLSNILNDIDAAVVVTPTSTHYKVVEELLAHGKHVFCEKPFVSEYNQALALIEKAKKANAIVQVGHSERFHEAWDILGGRTDLKKFTEGPLTIRINRLAPFKGRATDVDVIQDLMIHDIDLLLHLFGQWPKEVRTTGHKIRTSHWDHVCAEFTFESGNRAIITSGRNYVREERNLEVVSDAGTLFVDLHENKITCASKDTAPGSSSVDAIYYDKRDHLLIEQELFYNAIIHGDDVPVSIEDGANVVKIIERVNQSVNLNAPVSLA